MAAKSLMPCRDCGHLCPGYRLSICKEEQPNAETEIPQASMVGEGITTWLTKAHSELLFLPAGGEVTSFEPPVDSANLTQVLTWYRARTADTAPPWLSLWPLELYLTRGELGKEEREALQAVRVWFTTANNISFQMEAEY